MLRHGYNDQDEQPDRDNSHEYRGHGVSDAWIKSRVASGAGKASPKRLAAFKDNMIFAHDRARKKQRRGGISTASRRSANQQLQRTETAFHTANKTSGKKRRK